MKEYRCSWQIDVDAETPRQAAEAAECLMSGRVQSAWNVTDHANVSLVIDVRPVHEAPAKIGARIREFRRLCNADEHTDTGEAWDLLGWIEEHANDLPALRYRFILTVYSSRADIYGNRSHYARLVSTITGKSARFLTAAPGNARAAISKAAGGVSLSEICFTTDIDEVPIRIHSNLKEGCEYHENEITPELLQELETA